MRRSADQVMRAYVVERMRRASVQSRDMEVALTRVDESTHPRMSEEMWIESCLLTKGADERLWPILEEFFAGWDEDGQRRQSRAAEGASKFWPMGIGEYGLSVGRDEEPVVTQTAVGLTYQEACARAGVGAREGRKWWRDAIDVIGERLAARGER